MQPLFPVQRPLQDAQGDLLRQVERDRTGQRDRRGGAQGAHAAADTHLEATLRKVSHLVGLVAAQLERGDEVYRSSESLFQVQPSLVRQRLTDLQNVGTELVALDRARIGGAVFPAVVPFV